MSEQTKKRVIIFLAVLVLFLVYMYRVFDLEDDEKTSALFDGFYSEQEDTIDGVYLGTSAANRYWIPSDAFEKYGMTVYNLGTASQPLVLTKYLMKEVQKTQDPKLYIVELRSALEEPDGFSETFIRRVTDNMKLSFNRMDAINAALKYASKGNNTVTQDRSSYYLSFLKYHARWDGDIDLFDLTAIETRTRYKGYWTSTGKTLRTEPQTEVARTSAAGSMNEYTEDVLKDLLDYCDSLDADVMFVVSPYYPDSLTEQYVLNDAAKIVKSRGYPVLELNTSEKMKEIGLSGATDFYNSRHVNWYGATKFTAYMTEYIHKHYDLADHRKQKKYESWNQAAGRLKARIEKIKEKNDAKQAE